MMARVDEIIREIEAWIGRHGEGRLGHSGSLASALERAEEELEYTPTQAAHAAAAECWRPLRAAEDAVEAYEAALAAYYYDYDLEGTPPPYPDAEEAAAEEALQALVSALGAYWDTLDD